MAIGNLSILGLFYPVQLAPILLVQIIYKSVWIVAVALPLLAAGDPRALPFIIFFALLVALFAYAVPFGVLFGRQAGAAGLSSAPTPTQKRVAE